MSDFSKVGGRKFIMCVMTLASAHYLVAMGHITPEVYKFVVLGTVGVYVASNVIQKRFVKESQDASTTP